MLVARADAHPSAERLRLFGLGELHGSDADVIETHVETCEDCCRTVLGLAEDSFLAQIRAAKLSTATYRNLPAEEAPHDDVCTLTADRLPELDDHPRYRVFEMLGRGGMGAVYRAEHQLMQRPVAALSLADGRVVADPFTHTCELVELMKMRVRQIRRAS